MNLSWRYLMTKARVDADKTPLKERMDLEKIVPWG